VEKRQERYDAEVCELTLPGDTDKPAKVRDLMSLDDTDKLAYMTMRQAPSSSTDKHRHHHATQVNQYGLNPIMGVVMRNDPGDWKRVLVSRIC
jgi:hypothetical protein